jgi:hypothetical protein
MMRFENGVYHEPGLYFGMPDTEYHSDWSLGSTDLMNLMISPVDYYWYSRANPNRRPDSETPAMLYGKAIHKCVLEGREAFDSLYALKAPPPVEGSLISQDDLRRRCEELGLAKSGTKAEQIKRIRQIDATTPIYQEQLDEHLKTTEGKSLLDYQDWAEILLSAQNIRANPNLKEAFTNGYPEVSMFAEIGGVPMRCRFDYLKIRAIVDLKSTRNVLGMPWGQAVANFLARGNYHIQATHYLRMRQLIRKFVKEGKVFGEHDPAWLKRVAAEPDPSFIFVIYQADGAPLTQGVQFSHQNSDYALAIDQIETALARYKAGFERFGSSPWVEESKIENYENLPWPMWRVS